MAWARYGGALALVALGASAHPRPRIEALVRSLCGTGAAPETQLEAHRQLLLRGVPAFQALAGSLTEDGACHDELDGIRRIDALTALLCELPMNRRTRGKVLDTLVRPANAERGATEPLLLYLSDAFTRCDRAEQVEVLVEATAVLVSRGRPEALRMLTGARRLQASAVELAVATLEKRRDYATAFYVSELLRPHLDGIAAAATRLRPLALGSDDLVAEPMIEVLAQLGPDAELATRATRLLEVALTRCNRESVASLIEAFARLSPEGRRPLAESLASEPWVRCARTYPRSVAPLAPLPESLLRHCPECGRN